jgi:HK97 family phage portal protein
MFGSRFRQAEQRTIQATTWGDWPGDMSSTRTDAGINVDSSTALQLLTVYGCVRFIADSISTLPWDTFRKLPDGEAEEIPKPRWLVAPTVDLTFTEWCSQLLSSLLLDGNAYIAVLRSGSTIVELVPLDPAKVHVRRVGGVKTFEIAGQRYDGEICHIKGLMLPGSDVGLSPVECARQSIGLGMSAQSYGSQFFAGGANMPGVIELPGPSQPEVMASLAQSWAKKMSKSNKGKLPGVLPGGAHWVPTGVTNDQAQFLSTRQFTAAEIAAQMFMLDPTDLGIGEMGGKSLTYANLEQRNTRRVQVTFLPWLIRLEQAISGLLFNPRYFKFNVEGYLRGDTLSRYQSYQIGIGSGFMMPNEARAFEDLPPLPDTAGSPAAVGQEPPYGPANA